METLQQQRAGIKAMHGFDPGDSGALFLSLIQAEHAQNRVQIEDVSRRIDQSTHALRTDDPKASFWYGVGRGLPWAVTALVLGCLLGWFYWQSQAYQQTMLVLTKYPRAEQFANLMQLGQVETTSDGMLHLVLRPVEKGESPQVSRHYIYDRQCGCVRVPLGFR